MGHLRCWGRLWALLMVTEILWSSLKPTPVSSSFSVQASVVPAVSRLAAVGACWAEGPTFVGSSDEEQDAAPAAPVPTQSGSTLGGLVPTAWSLSDDEVQHWPSQSFA